MGDWFGKGCKYQSCQFERWNTREGYEEDRSFPVLVYCNHLGNEDNSEGNCTEKKCPLSKEQLRKANEEATSLDLIKEIYDCLDSLYSMGSGDLRRLPIELRKDEYSGPISVAHRQAKLLLDRLNKEVFWG